MLHNNNNNKDDDDDDDVAGEQRFDDQVLMIVCTPLLCMNIRCASPPVGFTVLITS